MADIALLCISGKIKKNCENIAKIVKKINLSHSEERFSVDDSAKIILTRFNMINKNYLQDNAK